MVPRVRDDRGNQGNKVSVCVPVVVPPAHSFEHLSLDISRPRSPTTKPTTSRATFYKIFELLEFEYSEGGGNRYDAKGVGRALSLQWLRPDGESGDRRPRRFTRR
jgi:hypothetical protein